MLRQTLSKQIITLAQELWGQELDTGGIEVSFAADPAFGDLACNAALVLARRLGKAPRDLAEALAERLRQRPEVAKVEVAGPGFINVFLTDGALYRAARGGGQARVVRSSRSQKVLVEYSDPNPFKPLHAGHLYTTLVGDMVSRLIERRGDEVIRLNYGGDVGLHVARAMWGIIQALGGEHPDKLEAAAGDDRAGWLGARYAEGSAADEDDPEAHKTIIAYNQRVYRLHETNDHESPFAQIYWTGRQWSYDYFKQLYTELQVKAFDRFIPESEVTPLAVKTVQEQLKQGVYERSDGAVIFRGEAYGLHTRVFINSVGLPTYDAKDVGLILMKWRDYHFDESIVITANEQSQYYEVMLKSVEQFEPEPVRRSRHLSHGMVKLTGGRKMSSRKGNVVTAMDILAAAREAGEATGTHPNSDTILAAVKYAFAKVRIGGDIVYDPKESIALEGNSGPYLQYAHARARSILAKLGRPAQANELVQPLDEAERRLMAKLAAYGDVVIEATETLLPHGICTYVYELAQTFNRFYERNRVAGDEREAVRRQLVEAYADVLRDGLTLLGIAAPDRL
ncbi:MAG TPA: arginine--tRNA ligase [Candidatus Saccharimonadia bacterium]